MTIYIEYCTK